MFDTHTSVDICADTDVNNHGSQLNPAVDYFIFFVLYFINLMLRVRTLKKCCFIFCLSNCTDQQNFFINNKTVPIFEKKKKKKRS